MKSLLQTLKSAMWDVMAAELFATQSYADFKKRAAEAGKDDAYWNYVNTPEINDSVLGRALARYLEDAQRSVDRKGKAKALAESFREELKRRQIPTVHVTALIRALSNDRDLELRWEDFQNVEADRYEAPQAEHLELKGGADRTYSPMDLYTEFDCSITSLRTWAMKAGVNVPTGKGSHNFRYSEDDRQQIIAWKSKKKSKLNPKSK